ncbi:hypothetical protein AGABI1DRAFT_47251 [Agaricus bisporus var. burnettii JB137-S8]|uniref:G-alpha-domain-containing protein n=1 Tax=Agaricus bisporus var. burnettii (strain JB137-S8 / ATCC MYA-4627 / FGSC 10392) TaxID=597362 RepID=K5WWB2_AGABU|nr:uncharacterized protein AGABI1DRAFT_47251 [Agaricus bisporus var. burnettii JB137-S8]EKM74867.1 hypothetical protein AGABI1DRAFT_47251 [Agaricus bisporus var. burnettii JB137-S8]
MSSSSSSPSNPFHARWAATPMPGESEEQTAARVNLLQEAVKRSKEIDENLQEAKKVIDRRKKAVRILLLDFQLAFAPAHFESERPSWKLIIQLNLISNIRTVIEALSLEWDSPAYATPTASPVVRNFRRIRLSLSPLFIIEANSWRMLAPESDTRIPSTCVRAGSGWKAFLQSHRYHRSPPRSPSRKEAPGSQPADPETEGVPALRRESHSSLNFESDPSQALIAQREEILWLWKDAEIQKTLQKRHFKVENMSGFFMNDIDRIARSDYLPTDSDIIRARLRTIGADEHHFVIEKGTDSVASDVFIADRASWVPYFDDVQAILFLAPLAFNQTLEEDPRMNRLEDSLNLWREICANRLLSGANLILFFNKKDVLAATLSAGVQVVRYVPSFGDAPNDITSVTKYFKDKFKSYHKRLSPVPRPFMCYETSAIDIKSMTVLLVGVRETILRQYLKSGEMI